MTPEERSRMSASMFAAHAADMAETSRRGAASAQQWADTSASIARTLAARIIPGAPDLAEMIAAGEPQAVKTEEARHA